MSLLADAPSGLKGSQRPRISWTPPYVTTAGPEAIDLAAMAGLELDEWQQTTLVGGLGEREDGKWSAFEVGLMVSRQNGKGGILEARELAGLYLIPTDRLIIHSAHQFDTSLEAFGRLLSLIENTRALHKRVKRVSHAHGQEGITLKDGSRIRFRTRTKGGGRGFTGDCLILDEAMDIPEATLAALFPTLSARPNPQVWYTGSAVDQQVDDNGVVFARVREKGIARSSHRLAYYEYSAPLDIEKVTPADCDNRENWVYANPALGIRIPEEYIEAERNSPMGIRKFAVERLGVGDWPRTDEQAEKLIDLPSWTACGDLASRISGPVCLAFDVTPDRSWASIAAAGFRADGLPHIEVIDRRRGTRWVVESLKKLKKAQKPRAIACDAGGPAGSLVTDVEGAGIELTLVTAKEHAQACGALYDLVMDGATLRHLGQEELTTAVDGASTRPLGDAWAWHRRSSSVDISPLVACTLALWAASKEAANVPDEPRVWNLAELLADDNEDDNDPLEEGSVLDPDLRRRLLAEIDEED